VLQTLVTTSLATHGAIPVPDELRAAIVANPPMELSVND
jgi:hypothetical protein